MLEKLEKSNWLFQYLRGHFHSPSRAGSGPRTTIWISLYSCSRAKDVEKMTHKLNCELLVPQSTILWLTRVARKKQGSNEATIMGEFKPLRLSLCQIREERRFRRYNRVQTRMLNSRERLQSRRDSVSWTERTGFYSGSNASFKDYFSKITFFKFKAQLSWEFQI